MLIQAAPIPVTGGATTDAASALVTSSANVAHGSLFQRDGGYALEVRTLKNPVAKRSEIVESGVRASDGASTVKSDSDVVINGGLSNPTLALYFVIYTLLSCTRSNLCSPRWTRSGRA